MSLVGGRALMSSPVIRHLRLAFDHRQGGGENAPMPLPASLAN
jgi:hypothetical protein